MVHEIIVACCDEEVKKIVITAASAVIGEKQIKICRDINDMYRLSRYAQDTAIIFDKYFLGYVMSYSLTRLKILNEKLLSYFVEIGDCSRFLAMRIYEFGCSGFISGIERADSFRKSLLKITTGAKVYPESIIKSVEEKEYLVDRKCITEVTKNEMAIGLYTALGKTQKEICGMTGMSRKAVILHTHRLKRKIGYKKPTDYNLLAKQYFFSQQGEQL